MRKQLFVLTLLLFFVQAINAQKIDKAEKAALHRITKILAKANMSIQDIEKQDKDIAKILTAKDQKAMKLKYKEIDSLFSVCGIFKDNKLNAKLVKESLLSKYDLNNQKNDTTTSLHHLILYVAFWDKNQELIEESSAIFLLEALKQTIKEADFDKKLYSTYYFIVSQGLRKKLSNDADRNNKQETTLTENTEQIKNERIQIISDSKVENDELTVIKVAETNDEETIFFMAEEMPQFPGGDLALRDFIQENAKHPNPDDKLTDVVYIRFVIDKEGDVSNVRIMRGFREDYNKEAIRVAYSFPKWKPAKQGGKIVKVWYTVPIRFK